MSQEEDKNILKNFFYSVDDVVRLMNEMNAAELSFVRNRVKITIKTGLTDNDIKNEWEPEEEEA